MLFKEVYSIICRRKVVTPMEYKIIASDLDGTLLTLDHTVSEKNHQAIEALQQKGILFVPASGRALREFPVEILEDPLYRYYIVSNGAAIYDKATGQMEEFALTPEISREVLDLLYSYDVFLSVHAGERSYCEITTHQEPHYRGFHMNDYWVSFALGKFTPIPEMKQFAYTQPTLQSIIPFFRNMEDKEACRAILEKDTRLSVAETDHHNLEIFSAAAGKGQALLHLANRLNIPREATIAVGDNINDSSMILAAGLGLAVENAAPLLKEQADEVICHFQEHSARYILEHYFK